MPSIFDLTTAEGRTVTVTAESLADAIIAHGGHAHVRHVGYAYTRVTPPVLEETDVDNPSPAPDLRTPVIANGAPLGDLAICMGLHPAIVRRRIRADYGLFRHVWLRDDHGRRGTRYVVTPDHVPYFVGLLV